VQSPFDNCSSGRSIRSNFSRLVGLFGPVGFVFHSINRNSLLKQVIIDLFTFFYHHLRTWCSATALSTSLTRSSWCRSLRTCWKAVVYSIRLTSTNSFILSINLSTGLLYAESSPKLTVKYKAKKGGGEKKS